MAIQIKMSMAIYIIWATSGYDLFFRCCGKEKDLSGGTVWTTYNMGMLGLNNNELAVFCSSVSRGYANKSLF